MNGLKLEQGTDAIGKLGEIWLEISGQLIPASDCDFRNGKMIIKVQTSVDKYKAAIGQTITELQGANPPAAKPGKKHNPYHVKVTRKKGVPLLSREEGVELPAPKVKLKKKGKK